MVDTCPAVGVATQDGRATCPRCGFSVESRATYARMPEHETLGDGVDPHLRHQEERAMGEMDWKEKYHRAVQSAADVERQLRIDLELASSTIAMMERQLECADELEEKRDESIRAAVANALELRAREEAARRGPLVLGMLCPTCNGTVPLFSMGIEARERQATSIPAETLGEAMAHVSRAVSLAQAAGEPQLAEALKAMNVVVARTRDVARERESTTTKEQEPTP